jgi:dCTP deaminase
LRLGRKFTFFKDAPNVTFSLLQGIGAVRDTALWTEQIIDGKDASGNTRTVVLKPGEFILGQTLEWVWIPRHLIGMVEGRSSYARAGISVHQTAPLLMPGWDGQITLEIRNSGKFKIELTPIEEMPCQITFLKMSSTIPKADAYGSSATDSFQHQGSALPGQKAHK